MYISIYIYLKLSFFSLYLSLSLLSLVRALSLSLLLSQSKDLNLGQNVRMFRRNGAADKTERRVPTVHPTATGVQILVFGHQSNCHRILLHLLRAFQCPRVLADFSNVLHHSLLHHHEATDKGGDRQQQQQHGI